MFKPYAGVSTAILLFTKTNSGGTDHVWFYDVDADGMSLDDKRTEPLPPERLGEVAQRAPGEILKALRPTGGGDSAGDEGTGRGAEVSKGWQTKPLGELLSFLTSGSRGWAEHYRASGDLFLRIQNVGRNRMMLDDVAFVAAPDTAEARRTLVQSGDVLLSITADLGRTGVVPDGIGRAFINQHLPILRVQNIHPPFLSAYLASPEGQKQVMGRNKHAVKARLNF